MALFIEVAMAQAEIALATKDHVEALRLYKLLNNYDTKRRKLLVRGEECCYGFSLETGCEIAEAALAQRNNRYIYEYQCDSWHNGSLCYRLKVLAGDATGYTGTLVHLCDCNRPEIAFGDWTWNNQCSAFENSSGTIMWQWDWVSRTWVKYEFDLKLRQFVETKAIGSQF